MPDLVPLVIATLAGVAAGFVNTLAGSGSFLTLPALIWLGLPSQIANATNRVGILIAAVVAVRTFPRGFGLPRRDLLRLSVPCCVGAVAGAMAAARMDPRALDFAIGLLMLAMLGVLLFDPARFLEERGDPADPRGLKTWLAFFLCGAYGGFIQAGVGIFLLFALVLSVGLPLRRANAVKLLLVLIFTVPAFCVFALEGQVRWGIGLLLAGGQSLGAVLAARFASKSTRANHWIRWILVVVLAATAARLLCREIL